MDVRILLWQAIPKLSFVSQIELKVAQRTQDRCPEPTHLFRPPPDLFLAPLSLLRDAIGIAPTFLERHLQSPREATESFGNLNRADCACPPPACSARTLPCPARWQLLLRGQEGAMECFRTPPLVAMHIKEGVDTRPVHFLQDLVHLRQLLERRRLVVVRNAASLPFPVIVKVIVIVSLT